MLEEILANLQVFSLPTKTNFRGINTREVAIIKGPNGYGEFSPFLEYGVDESIPWLASAIEAAFGEKFNLKLNEIRVNATMPAVNSRAEAEEILSWYPGCTTVKVKIGNNLDQDLERLSWVSDYQKIRIDVNGNWSVKEAKESIKEITNSFDIEYVEQPVASIEELRELELDIPVVGDEIIRKAKDPFVIDLRGAVDILMLKVAPLGGIKRSIAIAEKHRLPVVVSSALESAVGISHGLKLASVLEVSEPAGLATGALLKEDLGIHKIENGKIKLIDIEPAGIENTERLIWWQERIRNTFDAGLKQGWRW